MSSPLIIRAPLFLLFGFNKGTQKRKKGQKGTTRNLEYQSQLSRSQGPGHLHSGDKLVVVLHHPRRKLGIDSLSETETKAIIGSQTPDSADSPKGRRRSESASSA